MPAIQQAPVDFRYMAFSMDHHQLAKNRNDAQRKAAQLCGPRTDRFLDEMMYAVTSLAKSELGEERAAPCHSFNENPRH